jgi:succinylarginine dihydrolase
MSASPAAFEVNFDGLVGPTHNYAGLSYGNRASMSHRGTASNPRQAALQGLAKMKFLANLGLKQAALPPHERPAHPDPAAVRLHGQRRRCSREGATRGSGPPRGSVQQLEYVGRERCDRVAGARHVRRPHALHAANLVSLFHRSIETATTSAALRAIFRDERYFAHHPPLPATNHFADEGAANHTRLCARHGERGIEILTFGRVASDANSRLPGRFPARQTREASQAVARLHGLDPARTVFVQQDPTAIDAGRFTTTSSRSATNTCCSATSAPSPTAVGCWTRFAAPSPRRAATSWTCSRFPTRSSRSPTRCRRICSIVSL